MIEKRHVKCPHCGHEWDTKSKKAYTCCPDCMYKLNIAKNLALSFSMEHFNLDDKGVKILDKNIVSKNSPNGMIIEVFFKQGKAWCEYDENQDCKHIQYALSLPVVQEILKKKGWKT